MMKIKRIVVLLITMFLIVCGGVLVGCDNGSDDTEAKPNENVSTIVSLDETSLTMNVFQTYELRATANVEGTVSWASANDEIATVENGVITAKRVGETTVTATIEDGKAECKVIVEPAVLLVGVEDETVSLSEDDTYECAPSLQVNYKAATADSWSHVSSDNEVATVENGVITAVNKGSCTVLVTANYKGVTAKKEITVIVVSPPITFHLSKSELVLSERSGGEYPITEKLGYELILDGVAVSEGVTWRSENDEIVTVDEQGNVTAKKRGTVKVFAEYEEVQAWAIVTVKAVYEKRTYTEFFVAGSPILFPVDQGNYIEEVVDEEGNPYEYVVSDDGVVITSELERGRHTARFAAYDYEATVNFVVADVVIDSVEDVQNWQTKVSEQGTEYVVLAQDIACKGAAYTAVRNDFRGTFDGYNHEISGLNINYATLKVFSNVNIAVFLSASFSGTLQDLALTDVTYNPAGAYHKAGLANYMEGATIKNCYVSARVNSTTVSNEAYLLSQTLKNCTLQNNIIVELDGGNSTEQIVPSYTAHTDAAKTSNNLLMTNDTKFTDTTGFTCVLPANLTADNLKTFATTAGGDWVYDETTGELKLGSTVVYSSNANN